MKRKYISHFDRMNTPIATFEVTPERPTVRRVIEQVLDKRTSVVRNKCVMKTINRAEEMKPYRVSDFSLNNLLAIGAKLNPAHLSSSPHAAITAAEKTLAAIDSSINNFNNE